MSLIASSSLALALLTAPLALPGSAAAEPAPIIPSGAGLSAPAAVVETPGGGIWVADEFRGVCRVDLEPSANVVPSPWCGEPTLEPAEVDEDPTEDDSEEEAADPAGHIGPADPSGLVFDAGTSNFYAADRSSAGGAIWRLHLDEATGDIDEQQIVASLGGDRVDALTLGPGADPDVFLLTKRGGAIMRVDDPAEATEPQPMVQVGAVEGETHDITATDEALYVADGGLKRYALTGDTLNATDVAGFEGLTVTAVRADAERNRLYVGTANPDLDDVVGVLDLATGKAEIYEQGFSGVTALGVGTDGGLLVADDPIVATGAEGTIGEGRLWRVAMQPLNRPATTLTHAPEAISSAATASFGYTSRSGAGFECRLDNGTFEACAGAIEYRDLPEGHHYFWVRATDGALTGLPAKRAFTLDRTAPKVTVLKPDYDDFVEGGPAPRISFSVDERVTGYQCSLDGQAFRECWSGDPIEGLAAGDHVLRVFSVDAAGNESDREAESASLKIRIRARKRPSSPSVPSPSDAGAVPPATAAAPLLPAAGVTATAARRASARAPRLDSLTVRLWSSRPRLHVGFRATHGATTVKLWLVGARSRTLLRRSIAVRRAGWNDIHLRLTRAELRRLAPGRHMAIAVVSNARGTSGKAQTRWLRVPASRRGAVR